jgi:hypothetical protein
VNWILIADPLEPPAFDGVRVFEMPAQATPRSGIADMASSADY